MMRVQRLGVIGRLATLLALALCLVPLWRPVLADNPTFSGPPSLPHPQGQVILTVSGAIGLTNGPGVADFDRAMLEGLPSHRLVSETPWTDGSSAFEGFLLADLLAAAGLRADARGGRLRARALNDYEALIPLADLRKAEVLVAMKRDGRPMSLRDRGPLWILYPWSDNPGLRSEEFYARAVWQLRSLEVLP